MKYANFGTVSRAVSHGTMRLEDLLLDFASELEYHVQNNAEAWCSDNGRLQRDKYMELIGEAREIDADDENASEVLDELFGALNDFAPPYAYFGAYPGDGCDYGFWLSEDFSEQIAEFGLKVSDTSEVPDDYEGEVLHVNDHGNATLYSADHGKLTEIWSVV